MLNGILFTLADIAYYKVYCQYRWTNLTFGQMAHTGMAVSTLGPLTSLYSAVPLFLGIFILREGITVRKVLGAVRSCRFFHLICSVLCNASGLSLAG